MININNTTQAEVLSKKIETNSIQSSMKQGGEKQMNCQMSGEGKKANQVDNFEVSDKQQMRLMELRESILEGNYKIDAESLSEKITEALL